MSTPPPRDQGSPATDYDRYPELFQFCSKLPNLDGEIRVLSFGCSDGSEVRTLREKYFPEAWIDGEDYEPFLIAANIAANEDPKVRYFGKNEMAGRRYDFIFALSVLCVWGEDRPYYFEQFEDTLRYQIDPLLKVGGYLAIYNSGYFFEDTKLAMRYQKVSTPAIERHDLCRRRLGRGMVHKFHRGNPHIHTPDIPYGGVVFQKRAEDPGGQG